MIHNMRKTEEYQCYYNRKSPGEQEAEMGSNKLRQKCITNLSKKASLGLKRNLNLVPLVIQEFLKSQEGHPTERAVVVPVEADL